MPRQAEHIRAFTQLDGLQVREADDGGLTVDGIVVPFDAPTPIMERQGNRVVAYREVFRRGAFQDATRVPFRVSLVYGHSDDMPNRMGFGLTFDERAEGLHGTFRLDASTAEHSRDVLTTSHGGFSIGFVSVVPREGSEAPGALVERKRCALLHVAAVPEPAYVGARVGSIREPGGTPEETAALMRHQETAALAEFMAKAKAAQADLDRRLGASQY